MSGPFRNCKHCGGRLTAEAPGGFGYCASCLRVIVLEWEAKQNAPIDFEVVREERRYYEAAE